MANISLGFTGTQDGMTNHQKIAVVYLLSQIESRLSEIHHGDCVGADRDFHEICTTAGFYNLITTHPCNIHTKRAFSEAPKICKPKPPLDRNRDIVLLTDLLFVTPKEDKEILRSGTWATYRTAKKQNKKIIIVWPSGKFTKENAN